MPQGCTRFIAPGYCSSI